MVVACARVALKTPAREVDENSRDFWRWRDAILYSEDRLLEALCFDLTVESPFKTMYDMLQHLGVERNKPLRNAAWAFLSDSALTPLCLVVPSRAIAAASLFAAARRCDQAFADEDDAPWWAVQRVALADVQRACVLMAAVYDADPGADVDAALYVGLGQAAQDHLAATRLKSSAQCPESRPVSPEPMSRSSSDQSLERTRGETDDAPAPSASPASPHSQDSDKTGPKRPRHSNGRASLELEPAGHEAPTPGATSGAAGPHAPKVSAGDASLAASAHEDAAVADAAAQEVGSEEGEVEE